MDSWKQINSKNKKITYDAMHYTDKFQIAGFLVQTDFEKMFDSVELDSDLLPLDFCGFGLFIQKLIKICWQG